MCFIRLSCWVWMFETFWLIFRVPTFFLQTKETSNLVSLRKTIGSFPYAYEHLCRSFRTADKAFDYYVYLLFLYFCLPNLCLPLFTLPSLSIIYITFLALAFIKFLYLCLFSLCTSLLHFTEILLIEFI